MSQNHIKPDKLTWNPGNVEGFSARELMALDNGALKLIRVESNSSYPIHKHPDKSEFIYVLKGNPTITIDGDQLEGEPDDFFLLPLGIEHAIDNHDDKTCTLLVGAIKGG